MRYVKEKIILGLKREGNFAILEVYNDGKNIDEQNIGEMEIIGDNVSIGYFKNDELNSQKFEKKYETHAMLLCLHRFLPVFPLY